jgi:dihydrofolate synthase/folylpolyglutamate synthase
MPQNPLSYLNSLGLYKVKPGLDRINSLLDALGNPQDKAPCIIVGGTNGKGSVASAISSVLIQAGFKTGLYTSPHLVNLTERIRIDGSPITESELSDCLKRIRSAGAKSLKEEPSYFEVLTAAAFLYFSENDLDFSVLEVGMGGRWDATNVTHPLVSVITNISKEHTEYLGSTMRDIAQEKACIIKPGAPVVTGARGEALDVVISAAADNSSDLSVLGKDFTINEEANERFSYSGSIWKLDNLESSLHGLYQIENQALAVRVLEKLQETGRARIKEDILRRGLSRVDWEGRFQIVRDDPPVILDSAHNPGAAKALAASLRHSYPGVRFTFLIGMLGDKDHSAFIKEIAGVTEKIIITQAPSERGANTDSLSEAAGEYIDNIIIIDSYDEAYMELISSDSPACVTGSLYLIGALKPLTL